MDSATLASAYGSSLYDSLDASADAEQCIVVGSQDRHIYALDADSDRQDGSCSWRWNLNKEIEARVAVDPESKQLYAGDLSGRLWGLEKSPRLHPEQDCSGNPLSCSLTLERFATYAWCEDVDDEPVAPPELCDDDLDCSEGTCRKSYEPWGPRKLAGKIRFDPMVLRDASDGNRAVPDRLLIADDKKAFHWVTTEDPPLCELDRDGECDSLLTEQDRTRWRENGRGMRWHCEGTKTECRPSGTPCQGGAACLLADGYRAGSVLDQFPNSKGTRGVPLDIAESKLSLGARVKALQALRPATDPWPGFTMENPGRIYANTGKSQSKTGAIAFDMDIEGDEIRPAWLVYSNEKSVNWALTAHQGEKLFSVNATEAPYLQLQKASPVLSSDGAKLFVANRAENTSRSELGGYVFGLDTADPDQGGDPNLLALDDLPFEWRERNEGSSYAAAPAMARTRCTRWMGSDVDNDGFIGNGFIDPDAGPDGNPELTEDTVPAACCQNGYVDTIFVGDKNFNFYGILDCPDMSWNQRKKFPTLELRGEKTRSTPVIDTAIGTIYVGSDSDTDVESFFYALDMETGQIKWAYYVGVDTEQCGAAMNGHDCYPAPIPHVIDAAPVVAASGCVSQNRVALTVNAWTVAENTQGYTLPGEEIPTQFYYAAESDMESFLSQGLASLNLSGDLRWTNLARAGSGSPSDCSGDVCNVELAEGWNEIVIEAEDMLGKTGRSRVTLCYPGASTCDAVCGS